MKTLKSHLQAIWQRLQLGFLMITLAGFIVCANGTSAYADTSLVHSTTNRSPLLVHPGEGKSVSIPGEVFTFITRNSDTDGAYSTWELLVSPNSGPPLHKHDAVEESFEVLEGEITAQVDGKTYFAPAGSYINIPRGAAHTWKNTGTTMTKIRTLVVPGGMDDYFAAVGRSVRDKSAPIAAFKTEEAKRMVELGPKYGIEYLQPSVALRTIP